MPFVLAFRLKAEGGNAFLVAQVQFSGPNKSRIKGLTSKRPNVFLNFWISGWNYEYCYDISKNYYTSYKR